jgi:hypothetical protein
VRRLFLDQTGATSVCLLAGRHSRSSRLPNFDSALLSTVQLLTPLFSGLCSVLLICLPPLTLAVVIDFPVLPSTVELPLLFCLLPGTRCIRVPVFRFAMMK